MATAQKRANQIKIYQTAVNACAAAASTTKKQWRVKWNKKNALHKKRQQLYA